MSTKILLCSLLGVGIAAQVAFAATSASSARPRRTPVEAADAIDLEEDAPPEVVSGERAISLLRQARRHTVRVTASDGVHDGSGGGFVVRRFGELAIVVTNAHVILSETGHVRGQFTVSNESGATLTAYPLTWRLESMNVDYALLAVRDEAHALGDAVQLAAPRPGAFVVCVGHPLGESFLASKGHVGAIRGTTVEHDCISERGSSGGPVFDSAGRVVAIQTYVQPSDGHGIALDIKAVRKLTIEHTRVSAAEGWQDTGIEITGSAAALASGRWTYSGWYGATTPFGNSDSDLDTYSVDSKFSHAALICHVGANGQTVAIDGRWAGTGNGPTAVKRLGGRGTLWCRPNDRDVGNNGGALDLVIVTE